MAEYNFNNCSNSNSWPQCKKSKTKIDFFYLIYRLLSMEFIDNKIKSAYKILEGQYITYEQAVELYRTAGGNLLDLVSLASKVKAKFKGNNVNACTIINAKSGKCSEDCSFCAQSAHHNVDVDEYSLKQKDELVAAAKKAKQIGSKKFGIVTSGKGVKPGSDEFKVILETVKEIAENVGIEPCASLGVIDEESAIKLKKAGLTTYHHNLETAPSYYDKICTTHSMETRINTVKALKKAGLVVCSGGIIGMGESDEQRVELAFTLKELNVDSIPLNILQPIKGTPVHEKGNGRISVVDIIKTIAIFRIVNPDKIIKIAAGRETALRDFMGLAFLAGADGFLQGGYLTLKGRDVSDDNEFIRELRAFYK